MDPRSLMLVGVVTALVITAVATIALVVRTARRRASAQPIVARPPEVRQPKPAPTAAEAPAPADGHSGEPLIGADTQQPTRLAPPAPAQMPEEAASEHSASDSSIAEEPPTRAHGLPEMAPAATAPADMVEPTGVTFASDAMESLPVDLPLEENVELGTGMYEPASIPIADSLAPSIDLLVPEGGLEQPGLDIVAAPIPDPPTVSVIDETLQPDAVPSVQQPELTGGFLLEFDPPAPAEGPRDTEEPTFGVAPSFQILDHATMAHIEYPVEPVFFAEPEPVQQTGDPGLPPDSTVGTASGSAAAPAALDAFWESVLSEQQVTPIVEEEAELASADEVVSPGADAIELESEPEPESEPAPGPEAEPALQPGPEADRSQSPPIPVAAVPALRSERPAVVFREPPPPRFEQASELPPTAARPPRPRASVRGEGDRSAMDRGAPRLEPLASPTGLESSARDQVPEVVLGAPVEMWFGDHRVGVKQGTRTYDQFRRYANALFEDLRAARDR